MGESELLQVMTMTGKKREQRGPEGDEEAGNVKRAMIGFGSKIH